MRASRGGAKRRGLPPSALAATGRKLPSSVSADLWQNLSAAAGAWTRSLAGVSAGPPRSWWSARPGPVPLPSRSAGCSPLNTNGQMCDAGSFTARAYLGRGSGSDPRRWQRMPRLQEDQRGTSLWETVAQRTTLRCRSPLAASVQGAMAGRFQDLLPPRGAQVVDVAIEYLSSRNGDRRRKHRDDTTTGGATPGSRRHSREPICPLSCPPAGANGAVEPKSRGIIVRVSGVRVPPWTVSVVARNRTRNSPHSRLRA
jgi:hypothetical protein